MIKRLLAILTCALLIVSVFAGCQGTSSSVTSKTTTASANTNGTTLFGKVTAIDGNSITIALAENSLGGMNGQQPQGSPGAMPSGNQSQPQGSPGAIPSGNQSQPQGSPGAMPSGDQGQQGGGGQKPQGSPGAMPSGQQGQQPEASGGLQGGITLTGESKTITVTDSTVITTGTMGQNASSTKASLSDIKADSILTVTMSGDTVVSIAIMDTSSVAGAPGDSAPAASASSSS
jgi:hypothetical protein